MSDSRMADRSRMTGTGPLDRPDTRALNSWIEISEGAYAHNLAFFRRRIGSEVELSAVVKSNGYGHDLELVARLAVRHGADSFCVHALDEAHRLRRAGLGHDVLILGHVPLDRLGEVVAEDFRLVLFDPRTARRLAAEAEAQGRRARVHLKIETGTYRQGLDGEALDRLVEEMAALPQLDIEGAYTHFANIEDTTRHEVAEAQQRRFDAALARLAEHGVEPRVRHAACSAAILLFDDTHFDMVRLGISQYGLWPSKETWLSYRLEASRRGETDPERALAPVLAWKARISQVKNVPAEASIGYGCTYQTTRPTRLAILPIGYADGYDRRLSNQAHVLIHGRRAPVRGRVCMNLTLVDVTDIPQADLEDEAVLLGRQGDQEVTAGDLAGWVGTIPYEIVARLSPDIPRLLVD